MTAAHGAQPAGRPMPMPTRWDLFCRVIDNHGDIGVCWRLAADLASRGQAVRLWVDDASALRWMAPHGHPGVAVRDFADAANEQPTDIVVEAFGCDPPAGFVARMAGRARPPVWINLEYLSAEAWVERSHGLPSPQLAGAGAGLTKWFFFPGFSARTGGLIHETDLHARRRAFDAAAWLAAAGASPRAGERVVSLYCYPSAPLPALLDSLAQPGQPSTLLLAAPGAASERLAAAMGGTLQRGPLRALLLPYRSQRDFDHLLWASDLNFVRGEDSFVRAQFAGKPFVWQAYPQADGAHAAKLAAFMARSQDASVDVPAGAPAEPSAGARALVERLQSFWQAWNGLAPSMPPLPPLEPWRRHAESWQRHLLHLCAPPNDLTRRLIGFATERR